MQPIYDCFKTYNNYTCTLQQELYRDEYWCEIMPRRATKAMAVTELKKLWKCDYIVSFGDAINDIPMFQISDESYAVANAVEELKAIATGVIECSQHVKRNCFIIILHCIQFFYSFIFLCAQPQRILPEAVFYRQDVHLQQ